MQRRALSEETIDGTVQWALEKGACRAAGKRQRFSATDRLVPHDGPELRAAEVDVDQML